MSALAAFDGTRATAHAPRIQLLGTGTVGRAFVARFQQAGREGARLRFVGRFVGDAGAGIGIGADPPRASVGLRALPARHPLCGGSGTDNRVAIFSDRYREQPLVIQGPGAGAEVTAAALLDDVLRIAATARVRW